MEPKEPTAEGPSTFSELVEELLVEDEELNPDPVDLYEDELARRLGLRRHPTAANAGWRHARVRFANAHPDADRVAERMRKDEKESRQVWRCQ